MQWLKTKADAKLEDLSRGTIAGTTILHLNPMVAVQGAESDSGARSVNAVVKSNLRPQDKPHKKQAREAKRARAAIKKAKKKINGRIKEIFNLKAKIKTLKVTYQNGGDEGVETHQNRETKEVELAAEKKAAEKKAKLFIILSEKFDKRINDPWELLR